jgi:ribosome-binding protein aMBF1 (putative translation factor)
MGEVIPFRRRPQPPRRQRIERRPAPVRPPHPDRNDPQAPEQLWRVLVGDRLRDERRRRGETQADVAARAGISVQYLSELERGRKEPSSEVLAATAGALDLTLLDLTVAVARRLHADRVGPSRPTGPVALAA